MITAKMQGRRLVLTVETEEGEPPVEPFYISPMGAKAGRELSVRYLYTSEGLPIEDGDVAADMVRAVGQENYDRADEELSQNEGELILRAAYFWQSVGGMDAVHTLLEVDASGEQGGPDSRGKALAAFRLRMVPLLSQIKHHLESAIRTRAASTPATDTRSGSESSGSKPGEQPNSGPQSTPDQPPTPSPASSPATSD